jgi:hypothetical protein
MLAGTKILRDRGFLKVRQAASAGNRCHAYYAVGRSIATDLCTNANVLATRPVRYAS